MIIIFLLALLNLEFAHFLHYLSKEREFQEVYIYIGSLQVDFRVEQCSIR